MSADEPPFDSYRHDATACPACGVRLDASLNTTDVGRPNVGDVSVCAYCATLLVFGDGLTLRYPTDDELTELARDPGVGRARATVLAVIAKRRSADG